MLFRLIDHFLHHHLCQSMMLIFRIYRKIDHMQPPGLMELCRPCRIEIIFSKHKIPEGLCTRIFMDQPSICHQTFFQTDKIIVKCMTVIRLIRNDQDSFQLFTVRIHLTRFKTFRYIARK